MPNYKPKVCEGCGQGFTPSNGNQKKCHPCREKSPAPGQKADHPTHGSGHGGGAQLPGMAAQLPQRQQWAIRIRAKLTKATAATVEVGKDLLQAKNELPSGIWLEFLEEDLEMHQRTAERYMSIAASKVLSDPAYHHRLPAAMRTLAELATMDASLLQQAIEAGDITPETERAEATKVRKAYEHGEQDHLHDPEPGHGGSKDDKPGGGQPDAIDVLEALLTWTPEAAAIGVADRSTKAVFLAGQAMTWLAEFSGVLTVESVLPEDASVHGGTGGVVRFPAMVGEAEVVEAEVVEAEVVEDDNEQENET